MPTTAIKTYLEPDLARAVERVARAQGRSGSAFIADAVRARLASSSEQVERVEKESMQRALHRIEKRLEKIIWEEAQLKECLLQFIRVWLENNPPLEEALQDIAAIDAEARFERFLELLSKSLSGTSSIGRELDHRASTPFFVQRDEAKPASEAEIGEAVS